MPGAVTAHRVPGEIGSLAIRLENPLCVIEYFDCIETAPVFPVEPVRTAIGWSNDIQAGLAQ